MQFAKVDSNDLPKRNRLNEGYEDNKMLFVYGLAKNTF